MGYIDRKLEAMDHTRMKRNDVQTLPIEYLTNVGRVSSSAHPPCGEMERAMKIPKEIAL